jgi:hypothetical protein
MPKVKQLTVSCGNRPGTLAQVARVLGDAHVNIRGFLLRTSGAKGFLQLVVNNPDQAKQVLDRAGFPCTEETVLAASIPNSPGALGRFAARLAAKGINITSGFNTIMKGSRRASIILEVSRLDSALRVAANPFMAASASEPATNKSKKAPKERGCRGTSSMHGPCDGPAKRRCGHCGQWYCRTHFADPDWHYCAPEQGTG